jgi:type VI protein secretion system component VasK
MVGRPRCSLGFARLDLLLGLGVLAIIVAVVPPFWRIAEPVLDVSSWPRWVWIVANVVAIIVVVVVWQGPALFERRHERRTKQIVKSAEVDKQKQLAEQRELFKRMQEARKRQII